VETAIAAKTTLKIMPATMEPSSRTALPTPSVTSNATACHRLLAGDIGAACEANDASAVISIAPNTTCFTIDLLLGFFALVSSIVPIDGIFEIVRVVGSGLVSIAEVHAIIAGAHHAKSEPEMARDRFGFLERHDASKLYLGEPFVGGSAP